MPRRFIVTFTFGIEGEGPPPTTEDIVQALQGILRDTPHFLENATVIEAVTEEATAL